MAASATRLRGRERCYQLSLASKFVFSPVEEAQYCYPFHHASSRISQKFASRFQGSVYANVVVGSRVEVAGLGWMMGGLLRDVVRPRLVGKVPVACENLAKDRVQRLLDSSKASEIGG